MIKDIGGNILTSEESVLRVLKESFEELRNENERENKADGKNGSYKASEGSFVEVGTRNVICPEDMPVVVWRCLGESIVDF